MSTRKEWTQKVRDPNGPYHREDPWVPYFWETRDPVDVEHEMGTEIKFTE